MKFQMKLQIRSGQTPAAILLSTVRSMAHNEVPATAASIAYFTLFSIFPLLLLIVAVSDRYFNLFDVRSEALRAVLRFFPGLRTFIQNNIAAVEPSRQIIIPSAAIFVWTIFWLVARLETALNKAWQVATARHFIGSRLLALVMISVGSFFLGLSVTLTTVMTVVQRKIDELAVSHGATGMSGLWRVAFAATAFVLTFLVFTLVYKLVPNTRVALTEALTAGIVASTLWQIASLVFSALVRRLDYAAIYGSVGAVVAFLSWVYLSSYIFLFGAHLSAQMHRASPGNQSLIG